MINRIKQARYSYKLKKTVVSSVVTLALTMSGLSYADEYVDKAKDYITENKLDSAVIELKNAIQSSPNNAQPRIMLGEIYLDIGNFASAEKELSRALEYNADQNVVLPLLARTLSAQSKSEQVIELVQSSNPSDPYAKTELLALKAASEIKLGKIEDAKYSLELAQEFSYDSLYLQLGKAKLYAISNEVDAALETVNNILETTADNSDVWLLKGHLETANQNFTEATKSYRKAYEISPEAIYYSIFIANSLVYEKNFEDAEKYVDKLLTLAPNHILVNKLKATILYDKKDFVGAKEHADRALQGGSNDLTTQIIAAFSAYELKLYEQAYTLLKRIAPKVSDNHPAKRLLISTQFTLGYLDEAVDTMNDYPTESESDSSFVSAVSMKLSMLGRDEEALEFALKASESGGDTSDLLLGLIQLSSKDSTGIENLQSAIKNQPDMRKAQLGAGLYYIRYGYYMEAETVADQLLTKNPKDVDAITLRGQILQAKGEYTSAIELYSDALVIEPQNLNTIVALAQTHANLKQWEEAYSFAFQALELSPNNKDASQVILLAANEVKKLPELLRLVDSQLEQSPDNIELIHTKSKILMLSDRPSYALNLLESLPDAEKNSETWKFIGNFYYFEKKWQDAERAWARWLELAPTSAYAYVRNIHIKELTNKTGAGIVLAEKAEELFPNDVRFTVMRATFLFKKGDLNSSQAVLNGLSADVKKTPLLLKLQGLIYVKSGDYASAVSVYETRYEVIPGLDTAKELSSAYALNGQQQEAIDFLVGVIDKYPNKARTLELKLASLLTSLDPTKAIERYKMIITREPSNYLALNNLAWLLLEADKIDEAMMYAEQAYEYGGKRPQIADTYGYILLKGGETEKANDILKIVYADLEANPEVGLHYAESLIESNKINEAKIVLSKVVTEDLNLLELKGLLENRLGN